MSRILWGALWRSHNAIDGTRQYIINMNNHLPALFLTRREARKFIDKEFGYIRTRRDLLKEPHCWSVPIPVRVKVELHDR